MTLCVKSYDDRFKVVKFKEESLPHIFETHDAVAIFCRHGAQLERKQNFLINHIIRKAPGCIPVEIKALPVVDFGRSCTTVCN